MVKALATVAFSIAAAAFACWSLYSQIAPVLRMVGRLLSGQ